MAHILYSQAWLREPFLIQVPQPQVIWNHQLNKHVESRFFQPLIPWPTPQFSGFTDSPHAVIVSAPSFSRPKGTSFEQRFQDPRSHRMPSGLGTKSHLTGSPRKTGECPLKINGWKMYFLFLFRRHVSFRGV